MEYEIKKNEKKVSIKRKDELANGETANSSVIIAKNGINLQIHKNCQHSE